MELIFDNTEVKVYCFDLPAGGLNDQEMEILLGRLPQFLQKRIIAYKDKLDRQLRIVGKLMLQQLIKDFDLDKQLNLSQIKYSEYNRPFFNTGLFFSTSHSGNKVICAASKTNNIGVDIELTAPRDLNEFINLLSDKELNNIQKSKNPLIEFYKCWTKKEALAKAMGEGVRSGFMGETSKRKEFYVEENELSFAGKSYFFYELPVSSSYVAMMVIQV